MEKWMEEGTWDEGMRDKGKSWKKGGELGRRG